MNHNQRATINSLYTIACLIVIGGLILLMADAATIPEICPKGYEPGSIYCEKGSMSWGSLAIIFPGLIALAGVIVAHVSLPRNVPADMTKAT